jgi:hypothetical protein
MQPAVLYVSAVLGIILIAVGGVVSLEVLRPDGVNTQAAYTIVGICTPTLAVLIGLIKSIGNGQAIEEAKQTAATAVIETRAAHYEVPAKTAEAVRSVLAEASREPPP